MLPWIKTETEMLLRYLEGPVPEGRTYDEGHADILRELVDGRTGF